MERVVSGRGRFLRGLTLEITFVFFNFVGTRAHPFQLSPALPRFLHANRKQLGSKPCQLPYPAMPIRNRPRKNGRDESTPPLPCPSLLSLLFEGNYTFGSKFNRVIVDTYRLIFPTLDPTSSPTERRPDPRLLPRLPPGGGRARGVGVVARRSTTTVMGGNWTKQPQIGPPAEGSPGRRTLIVILVICICRYFAFGHVYALRDTYVDARHREPGRQK